MKSVTAEIPVGVSMFVYIEMASAENNKAFSGMCMLLSSSIVLKEFFTYDCTSGRSSFIF